MDEIGYSVLCSVWLLTGDTADEEENGQDGKISSGLQETESKCHSGCEISYISDKNKWTV